MPKPQGLLRPQYDLQGLWDQGSHREGLSDQEPKHGKQERGADHRQPGDVQHQDGHLCFNAFEGLDPIDAFNILDEKNELCKLETAGLETSAPKSCSPPEHRGQGTGAEVPVPSAIIVQLTSSPTRPHSRCPSQLQDQDAAVITHEDLLIIDNPADRWLFAKTPNDPPILTTTTDTASKESPRAERTPAPQSFSYQEHRGLSPGATVPMEVSISWLTTSSCSTNLETQSVQPDISRAAPTMPLRHKEHMQEPGSLGQRKETKPHLSPRLPVGLKVHTDNFPPLANPDARRMRVEPLLPGGDDLHPPGVFGHPQLRPGQGRSPRQEQPPGRS